MPILPFIDDDELVEIFRSTRTIAVLGASTTERKQAHRIPAYLQSQGYRIIPVNPAADEIFGEPTAVSLAAIEEPVDVVDVFRPSEETPAIAAEAVDRGARVLWLQMGIRSNEAARIAREGGLTAVMDTCMGAVHKKLVRLGLV
jgi:predicted CoA-binding protein